MRNIRNNGLLIDRQAIEAILEYMAGVRDKKGETIKKYLFAVLHNEIYNMALKKCYKSGDMETYKKIAKNKKPLEWNIFLKNEEKEHKNE